jgi:hypothetical protein
MIYSKCNTSKILDEEYTYFLEEIIMYINSRENLEEIKKRVNIYIFENIFKCPSAAQNSDPDAKIVSFYELVLNYYFFGAKYLMKTEIHERLYIRFSYAHVKKRCLGMF